MYSSEKMSSPSDDTDDLMIDPLAEELRNIESVINVTSRNIDALNAKFANRQDPPPMYISEYQELTSRLHELEEKKLELTEKMQQNESPEPPEESLEVNSYFILIVLVAFWSTSSQHSTNHNLSSKRRNDEQNPNETFFREFMLFSYIEIVCGILLQRFV